MTEQRINENGAGVFLHAARRYREQGFALVPAKGKRPFVAGWEAEGTPPEEDARYWGNGHAYNMGVVLGEASGGLADIERDCDLPVRIDPMFLPDSLMSGREKRPHTHSFYYCPGIRPRALYDASGKKFFEVRSDGQQTILPPSRHPVDGDKYIWHRETGSIATVDPKALDQAANEYATALLLALHMPPVGSRHDYALAAAGYMLRGGRLEAETLYRIFLGAWKAQRADTRETVKELESAVFDTAEKLANGEEVKGGGALGEIVEGLPKRLSRIWGWGRSDSPTNNQSTDEDELSRIVVNNRHLRDVTADALKALTAHNRPPEVFVRSGSLVRVREDENGTPEIQLMELGHVRGRLARVADFARITDHGETRVNPPEVVVKDIMALGAWPFPALEAVVESPILRPNGSVFEQPGYDQETRLYYRPANGFELPKIPKIPKTADIRTALDLVNEAIGEFPFADESSAANTLALLLSPVVRQAIDGPVPMALIDKPQAGTGGSLLAETAAIIGSGRTAEMLGAPRDDEEWRKQITAKLSAGATMITVDNVEGALYAPSLARALTARTWTDRVLGRSETVTVSQRATWIATGNNIILRGDLPRRCYWIRLDAKDSRPWQRQHFRHPDLLSWVMRKRGHLVHALLTIARAWFAAGKPKADKLPRLGGFECWAETVGGMVDFAGIPGFLGNLNDLYDKADESGAEWEGFLSAWHAHHGEDPITVAELTKLIKDNNHFRAALPSDLLEALDKSDGGFTRRMGNALSKRAGTRYGEDELHVAVAGEFRRAKQWSVRAGSSECEFVSFVSLYNPSASKNYANNANNKGKPAEEGSEINSTNSQTHRRLAEEEARDPEDAALLAAGWKPRDRGDTSVWVSPESGFAYSREMALAQLERDREAGPEEGGEA